MLRGADTPPTDSKNNSREFEVDLSEHSATMIALQNNTYCGNDHYTRSFKSTQGQNSSDVKKPSSSKDSKSVTVKKFTKLSSTSSSSSSSSSSLSSAPSSTSVSKSDATDYNRYPTAMTALINDQRPKRPANISQENKKTPIKKAKAQTKAKAGSDISMSPGEKLFLGEDHSCIVLLICSL